MEKWLSDLEQMLPHWLENKQTQSVQWIYAIWQLLRCNPLILLVLSYLPFMLSQCYRKKTVVVLGNSREYFMDPDDQRDYFVRNRPGRTKFILGKLEEITKLEDHPDSPNSWFTVKYHSYYYITHMNTLGDLKTCIDLFGENIIFVEKLLKVSGIVAVGKQLSETEAYEKILSKRYKCSKGSKLVVPTSFNYVDFSSKFWVVMGTLPILLQANSYKKISNLLILMIILLDLNRSRLYRLYDRLFNDLVIFVKLNVFKGRTSLYDFFSMLGKRWQYTDTVKRHAYVAKPGDRLKISYYSKLESPDDIKIVGWEQYMKDPNVENIFMEIAIDKAHCSLMTYNSFYAEVELKRPVYVL